MTGDREHEEWLARFAVPADAAVPAKVRELAGDDRLEPVWRNGLGGLTFRAGDRYVKHGPRHAETSMAGEAERLVWAGSFTRVPRVVTGGRMPRTSGS